MSVIVVVGAQLGDESKGKVVDLYAEHAHMVVRFNGGANAGHTLMVGDKKVITHLVPSGVMHDHITCVLGEGMVIDPIELLKELEACAALGLNPKLLISKSAHVVAPYHKLLDAAREGSTNVIGTTRKGIGPAYESKAARFGIRMADLLDIAKVEEIAGGHLRRHHLPIFLREATEELCAAGQKLAPFFTDTSAAVNRAIDRGENVILEGAQSALLDIDHGVYPHVSSSHATAGGACASLGIGPTKINSVIGVAKVYTTQVGTGPFPTRMDKSTEDTWREAGGEYGSTTGRPRKCGWLDLPALKRAIRINGMDYLAWAKLDILFSQPQAKICTGYEMDGRFLDEMPTETSELKRAVPILEDLPTFSGKDKMDKLVDYLGERVGIPDALYSYGPRREETIVRYNPFLK